MEDQKIYLLAESTVLPGFLEEVRAIFNEALIPTLQEPGCEAHSSDWHMAHLNRRDVDSTRKS